MRLTLPRARVSWIWLLKNEWVRKGVYWDPKPVIPKIYQEKGVKIVDALEEYGKHERIKWSPPDPDDPRYNPPVPRFQQSVDYHEKPELVFGIRTKLSEGAPQAQVLTNSQILEGVPEGVKNLRGKISVPNQDELCKRYIFQANRWDATKVPLPRRFNVHRQAFKFKAEVGIPKKRISSTMIRNLLRLCLTAGAMQPELHNTRKLFYDYFMSNEISYDTSKILVQGLMEAAITSQDPAPPFADDSVINSTTNYSLPDLYPLKPTIEIVPSKIYVDFLSNGFKEGKALNVHTMIFNNMPYWSPEATAAHAIVFLHSQALLQAKAKYGEGTDLPRPISVQSIQTNGQDFHFTYFQLNTRDTRSDVKNLVWFDKDNALYKRLEPPKGMLRNTVYEDYDPKVLQKIMANFWYGANVVL